MLYCCNSLSQRNQQINCLSINDTLYLSITLAQNDRLYDRITQVTRVVVMVTRVVVRVTRVVVMVTRVVVMVTRVVTQATACNSLLAIIMQLADNLYNFPVFTATFIVQLLF